MASYNLSDNMDKKKKEEQSLHNSLSLFNNNIFILYNFINVPALIGNDPSMYIRKNNMCTHKYILH